MPALFPRPTGSPSQRSEGMKMCLISIVVRFAFHYQTISHFNKLYAGSGNAPFGTSLLVSRACSFLLEFPEELWLFPLSSLVGSIVEVVRGNAHFLFCHTSAVNSSINVFVRLTFCCAERQTQTHF